MTGTDGGGWPLISSYNEWGVGKGTTRGTWGSLCKMTEVKSHRTRMHHVSTRRRAQAQPPRETCPNLPRKPFCILFQPQFLFLDNLTAPAGQIHLPVFLACRTRIRCHRHLRLLRSATTKGRRSLHSRLHRTAASVVSVTISYFL